MSNILAGSGVAMTKTTAGVVTLSGANTFNGGLVIKNGTVIGQTSASAFGAGTITLGDSAGGSNNATIQSGSNTTFANAIVLASSTTGTLTILTTGNTAPTFTGGVTGTNNLVVSNTDANGFSPAFSTGSINNAGTVTNSGTGSGGVTINAVIGANVTGVIQNSSTSPLSLGGNNTFSSGATIKAGTLIGLNNANAFGTGTTTIGDSSGGSNNATLRGGATLTFANPIVLASTTTGILTIDNAVGIAPNFSGGVTGINSFNTKNINTNGFTFTLSGSINNTGSITNSGSGSNAPVIISGVIGSNVTGLIQNSTTSALTLSGNNSTISGNITIATGTLAVSGTTAISLTGDFSNSGSFAAASGTVTLASGTHAVTGTSTFNNLSLAPNNTVTFPVSATQTISNAFSCTGTAGNVITINSSVPGTQATLSMGAGKTATCDYLSLKDSAATGGATWNAGSHSTFVSNDSGWGITVFPGVLSNISYSGNSATLSWSSATGGVAPIIAQLQRSLSGLGSWSNVTGATASPATDTGLTTSTAYDYRVAFTDALSTVSYSNIVTITTNSVASTTYVVQRADLWDNGYDNVNNPRQSTFARFVFTTDAASITVTGDSSMYGNTPSWAHFGLRINGVDQSPLVFASTSQSFTVNLGSAGTTRTVEIVDGLQSLPGGTTVYRTFVNSVTYSNSSTFTVTPPVVSNRVVVYGDSIAAGGNSTNPESEAYIPLLRNLYGQNIMAEAWGLRSLANDVEISLALNIPALNALVSRFASYTPSTIYLAIGTNDYGASAWSASDFGSAYGLFLDDLHAALPSTRIICQTPLLRSPETANTFGNTLGDYRAQITTACNARSWTTLVDGTTLLTVVETGGLHPDTPGHAKYAKRVAPILAQPSYSVSGPTSGISQATSTAFTVTLGSGAPFLGDQAITVAASDGTLTASSTGGSISGNGTGSVAITATSSATLFTFTYTPASVGTKTLTFTNNQSGWTNPNHSTYNSLSPVALPTLTIQAASALSTSTATLNATITADGNASSTIEGFNYGLTTGYGSTASSTGTFGTGTFTQNITGLSPSTTYHFRAFAINSGGTGTSSDSTFTTSALPAPVISAIASSTAQTTATITWTTDQAASSTVSYGLTAGYGTASTSAALVTSHSIILNGLTAATTYHFQVGGANSFGTISTSSDLTFVTSAIPDVTPPTVSLTAPTNSSTISGSSVTLTATSSDNIAVASVQFKIDGASTGVSGATSPYSIVWNSTGVADGSHTIAAVASDAAGNLATSSVTVTVQNSSPVITSIASSTTQTTATFTWTTNNTANSTVNYGVMSAYGTASTSATFVTSHSVTVTGLAAGTTYHFQVGGSDVVGNTSTSTDRTFTTSSLTVTAPTVITSAATSISISTALLNGAITADGNASSTIRGFNLGLTTTYTVTTTHIGTFGLGSFSTTTLSLSPGTLYHFRAYATNAAGTGYGSDQTFTTAAQIAPIPTPTPTPTATVVPSQGESGFAPGYGPSVASMFAQPPVGNSAPAPVTEAFTHDLSASTANSDVRSLQEYLNAEGFAVSKVGAGSPGKETTVFGPATKAALIRFQKAHGIKPASGFFGPITRAYINTHH